MRGEDFPPFLEPSTDLGSPPHARGRRKRFTADSQTFRITPACAGKTTKRVASVSTVKDHPRMRGEDRLPLTVLGKAAGSPPHARGRLLRRRQRRLRRRITPACAGKTSVRLVQSADREDHPRMRGEDAAPIAAQFSSHGSPPHARGRQLDSPGNPAKSSSSLPVFFCSQPSPLGWFLRWVLGLGLNLWKQR